MAITTRPTSANPKRHPLIVPQQSARLPPRLEDEIVALLKSEEDAKDKKIQTDISDEDLERVLDRSDLIATARKSRG
ncbi:hypothetical protein Tco_1543205 [Tanacetum coccineum]